MVADFFVDLFENIKRALLSFGGLIDLFDVVLVAFVIYSAIKLIRGTRAFQLAKGVLVLAALYAIVTLLGFIFFLIAFFLWVGASLRMSDKEFIEQSTKSFARGVEQWYKKK